MTSIDDDG
jgi:hypothetical protein